MKLRSLVEDELSRRRRAAMHSQVSQEFRSGDEKKVIDRVRRHLVKGDNDLKDSLRSGEITMDHIISAIKQHRCINIGDEDVGHTYMRNVLGNAIRADIPEPYIKAARRLFGLEI